MSIVVVDRTDRSIGTKVFMKYGSCMIEYIGYTPIFSYLKNSVWIKIKPSEYSEL